jgi:hypothetical protein
MFLLIQAAACGSNDPPANTGPGTQTGSTCAVAADCYPGVQDVTTIQGSVQCLTQVPNGYCTHTCTADGDCCHAPGECPDNLPEVCSPFESQPQSYCFLSCEPADVKAAGYTDATAYCHDFASTAFTCRSTGGGAKNRMICSVG